MASTRITNVEESPSHLPRRRIGVENLLADTNRTINSFSFSEDQPNVLIDRLKEVKQEVLKKEEEFYTDLKINSKNPEEGLREFQKRLDDFLCNPLMSALSPNGAVIRALSDKYEFSKEVRTDSELIDQLVKIVEINTDQIIETQEDELVQMIITELNKKNLGHNFKLTKKVGAKNVDTTLTAAIKVITKNIKNNPTSTVQYEGDSDRLLSKKMRSSIKKFIDNYNNSKKQKVEKKMKKSIMEISKQDLLNEIILICQQINSTSTISNDTLSKMIIEKAASGEIFINRNKSTITGFLGELQTGLFLQGLGIEHDSKAAQVVYTGAMRYIEGRTGQEIITDIAIKGYGFQVKSYEKSNTFVVSGTLQGNNFINNRFRIDDKSLQKALINLFGVYQYNRPFPLDGKSDSKKQSIAAYQSEVYDTIDTSFKNAKKILDSYADNALGISDSVSVSDLKFMDEKIYFNTFFLISGRIIPASKILSGIIINLLNTSKKYISSSYSLLLKDTTAYTLYNYLNKDKGTGLTAEESAAQMLVSYSITLYLDEILSVPLE